MIRQPPTLDMLPDGTFRTAPVPPRMPLSIKLGVGAALVAIVGASIAVAAFALWIVSLLLPVIIIAGGVAYGMMRYRRWQLLRGQRDGYPAQPGRFGQ